VFKRTVHAQEVSRLKAVARASSSRIDVVEFYMLN
jgi:hypothetical protein